MSFPVMSESIRARMSGGIEIRVLSRNALRVMAVRASKPPSGSRTPDLSSPAGSAFEVASIASDILHNVCRPGVAQTYPLDVVVGIDTHFVGARLAYPGPRPT